MKNQITFEANGLICTIYADKDLIKLIKEDQFTYHYMIGAKEIDFQKSDVELRQDDMINDPVLINYPRARFQKKLSPRDVVVVGEYLLERARQEKKGLYNLSSACASRGDFAVTFFGGATNLGKTSSTLSLIQRCGFEFISDEKTLLDLEGKRIIGGAISIPTRKDIIKKKFFSGDGATIPEYKEMEIARGFKKAAFMIYPHLDDGQSKPIFYKWKPLDFYWMLTRDLSYEIRGGIRLIDNFGFLLPSLDNPQLTKVRIDKTREFCDIVPCYYFQGSLDQVVECIPRLLDEKNDR
jgi:hypothetical protein